MAATFKEKEKELGKQLAEIEDIDKKMRFLNKKAVKKTKGK